VYPFKEGDFSTPTKGDYCTPDDTSRRERTFEDRRRPSRQARTEGGARKVLSLFLCRQKVFQKDSETRT